MDVAFPSPHVERRQGWKWLLMMSTPRCGRPPVEGRRLGANHVLYPPGFSSPKYNPFPTCEIPCSRVEDAEHRFQVPLSSSIRPWGKPCCGCVLSKYLCWAMSFFPLSIQSSTYENRGRNSSWEFLSTLTPCGLNAESVSSGISLTFTRCGTEAESGEYYLSQI